MKQLLLVGMTLICLLYASLEGKGQADPLGDAIEKDAESGESVRDYSQLVEELTELSRHPLSLNRSGIEEIGAIPFLSETQKNALQRYLLAYGEVFSIYELAAVPGFDSTLIRKIAPYISIGAVPKNPPPTPRNLLKRGRHDLLIRYGRLFPAAQAYTADDSLLNTNPEKYYPGSPDRLFFRYTYHYYDKVQIGLAGEKDPGEQFFTGAQKAGMDCYSGYLSVSNMGILSRFVIGNFRISFGQGLTASTGVVLGSTPGFSSASVAKGIKPGTSTNEGDYLRGIGLSLKFKPVTGSLFISYHPRDATVLAVDSASQEPAGISAFVNGGYHRTPREISKKNAIHELVYGGNVDYTLHPDLHTGIRFGVTCIGWHYDAALQPSPEPYRLFTFSGNDNFVAGIDVELRRRYLHCFAELSRSNNGALAWLAGVNFMPDPGFNILVKARNYSPHYQNLFSNAFGQNSVNANEKGIYCAISVTLLPKLTLTGYLDLFSFPWLRYRVDAPGGGQEFGMMATLQATRDMILQLRYYQKNSERNLPVESEARVHQKGGLKSGDLRFDLVWDPFPTLRCQSRFEWKHAGEQGVLPQHGFLVYQQFRLQPVRWPLTFTGRFTLFDTRGYDSRIYVFEPEVLYGYSVPAYDGKGLTVCAVVKGRIGRFADVWVRGGWIWYSDRTVIGSGIDQTAGNTRFELTCQVLISI